MQEDESVAVALTSERESKETVLASVLSDQSNKHVRTEKNM